jgi:hypothetical protein
MTEPQRLTLNLADNVGKEDDHAVPAPEAPSPETPKKPPTKLEEIDRLKVAELHLIILNCQLQEEQLKAEAAKAHARAEETYVRLVTLRGELSKKYGIDFARVKVREDGAIEYMQEQPGIPAALAALLRPGG